MSDDLAPLPKRVIKPALSLEEEFPEMFFPLLPKSYKDSIKPVKHRPKVKKVKSPKASPKKAKTPKAPKAAKKTGTGKKAGKKAPAKKAPKKAVVKKAATKAPVLVKAASFTASAGGLKSGGFTVETGGTLSKADSAATDVLFRRGSQTHKWQFLADGGKWNDYDGEASKAVELAHSAWVVNPHIDVRSVKSGSWEYMVDFNMMQQQNTKHEAHKIRKIQRVPLV